MKKQTVVLLWSAILLFVVASCVGGYYIRDGSAGFTKNRSTVAFNCISTDIEEYTVIDNGTEYTIKRSTEGWCIDDKPKIKLDQEKVGKLIASASNITATGTVSRKDFEKNYTKEEKRLEIDIDRGEDAEIRFVGTYENLCAFKVSDDKKIYVMNSSMRDILAPKLDSLRIATVYTSLSKIETLPDYYRYQDYDGSVVEIRSKNATELAKGKGNRYIMEKPYRRGVDDDRFEQGIALKIPAIVVKSFVEKPEAELAVYGLDADSRAELSFSWDEKSETLYLGKTENGAVYALKKNTDDIFTIETGLLEFLKLDPFYLLENGVLRSHISNVVSVEAVLERDMVFAVSAEGRKSDTPKYFVGGKMATKEVFEEVLDELEDIKFFSELGEAPKDTGDIVLTIGYEGGAAKQKIRLAKMNNKCYAAFIDGKAEFAVDSESVNDLIEELKEAYQNPMKKD